MTVKVAIIRGGECLVAGVMEALFRWLQLRELPLGIIALNDDFIAAWSLVRAGVCSAFVAALTYFSSHWSSCPLHL